MAVKRKRIPRYRKVQVNGYEYYRTDVEGADGKYLAGHESSKITLDIYAKVKYNRPDELAGVLSGAFAQWDAGAEQ